MRNDSNTRLTHSRGGVWVVDDDSNRHGNDLRPGTACCIPLQSNPTHTQAAREGGREGERERKEKERKREKERERERERENIDKCSRIKLSF